ncbi:MAG: hypothetical protein EVB11_07070 [Winogradskyella sp.]|nr:MAG: hypothetical protein EVB11_07070 [Winogradskyella sp.]
MRNIFVVLFALFLMTSCDDGDIITVDLSFDQELSICENNTESFIVYDLRNDPSESLSLLFPRTGNETLFTDPTPENTPATLTINGSSIRFIYRTYNRDIVDTTTNQEFCNTLTPADLIILEDYEAMDGDVEVTVTVVDDDNDGIPTSFEGADPNGDGDFSDSLDTDGDGIFDYLDEDDDNDNVKTINEIDNTDGDDDPTTNPMNSDFGLVNGDDIPDYLDTDDDGDMVPTIEEDEDGDMNPRDDLANNADNIQVPHYLNTIETINYGNPGNTSNNIYTRTVNTSFMVKEIDLEILRTDIVDLGTLVSTISVEQD